MAERESKNIKFDAHVDAIEKHKPETVHNFV